MSVASSAASEVSRPQQARRPVGLWVAAVVYCWVAFGPFPMYYYLRATGHLSEERWPATTPFHEYTGLGLGYHGSAALCFYFLVTRRVHALWAALLVAVSPGIRTASLVVASVQGLPVKALSWSAPFLFVLFSLLALYVRALRQRGSLQ